MKYSVISVKSDVILPYKFIGSTIRGAVGNELKKVVCINPTRECKGCFAKDDCLYFDMYEVENPKFRLKINLEGNVNFEILLFEELTQKIPYLVAAVYKVLKERGISKNRIKANQLEIKVNDEIIYNGKNFKEIKKESLSFNINGFSPKIHLNISTPIRIKDNNKLVRKNLKLETLLRSIWHRFNRLKNRSFSKLPFEPEYKLINKSLSFVDFTRYSNRQKTKMKLGGVIGFLDIEVDEDSYKLLKIGEIIGVGKQVTFGFGNIKVYNEI